MLYVTERWRPEADAAASSDAILIRISRLMHHSISYRVVLTILWMAAATVCPAWAQDVDILRVGYREPDTLDPHAAVVGPSQAIVRLLYRGLTRFAIRDGRVSTSEVDPDLAESWVEPEGNDLTWVFRLRQGVEFHHAFGEMTADDVKFSFERQLQGSQHMAYTRNLDIISAIDVINSHTLSITLKYPDPLFPLRIVGYQQGYIVSKKAVQLYGERFQWNPVGTGPFYFDQRLVDEKIILKTHFAYQDPLETHQGATIKRSNIDEVHWFDVRDDATALLGLKHGAFDIIFPNVITRALVASVEQAGAVLDKRGPGTLWALFFNTAKRPFDEIEFRRAVMSAIDRKAIQTASWLEELSTLATSPLPRGYVGHMAVEIPPYDPDNAKALLSQAIHIHPSLDTHVISQNPTYHQTMALVQKQLEAVGIHLPLVVVDHEAYHEHIRANANGMVLYGAARITHGHVMLGQFYHSSQIPSAHSNAQGTNFSHYRDLDSLLDHALQSQSPENRDAFYHQAQQRLIADAVVLPLVVVPDTSVRNPKHVHTPFDPERGESALHYFYNYPERFELLR